MSKHLFGLVVTPHGTAANNRGETEGNLTTLQKILWNGEVHTTVSAEAIRWAIRWYWQRVRGEDVLNRRWEEKEKPHHKWSDHEFTAWQKYLDDDVLGFMSAEAAKEEGNEVESQPIGGKRGRKRGIARIRRGCLEVTRAISLTPFAGDITFNAASVGATPSASRTGTDPVPYGTEVHATRYQYGFTLTPEGLYEGSRVLDVVDAIISLSEVAGNHSRFLYDFSPESVIFRWTDDFAPRLLYSFQLDADGRLIVPDVLRRTDTSNSDDIPDIDPAELVVGGSIADLPDGQKLKNKGAYVLKGVKAAAEEVKRRIKTTLQLT